MDIAPFAWWETPAQPTPGPWIRSMRWRSFAETRTCGSTWTLPTEDLRRAPKPPGDSFGDWTGPIQSWSTRTNGCTYRRRLGAFWVGNRERPPAPFRH